MSNTNDATYNGESFLKMMMDTAYMAIQQPGREWFHRERTRYSLHPFVQKAILMARPNDWQDLLLQWPHQSTLHPLDQTKVAYTRDERSGINDKQTVTNLGRYLHQHFSTLPDHAIRDLVALATPQHITFKFVNDVDSMIAHLNAGPSSCMVWEEGDEDDGLLEGENGGSYHPYHTYDPEFGWHMAVRMEGANTVGRALCMKAGHGKHGKHGRPFFVRSYKKTEGYSPSDEQLEAWLRDQGYEKSPSWEGCKLKFIPIPGNTCGFLAPYIDGGAQHVDVSGLDPNRTLTIVGDGEYICNNTDGDADEAEYETCEDCNDRIDGDEHWAGRYEDRRVCSCCIDNYRHAISRHGYHRYIYEDDVVWVESQGEYYDIYCLEANSIVEMAGGDYEHRDNCVQCCDNDKWYHQDDPQVVECVDDNEYHLRTEAHYHEESGQWYADEDEMPQDDEDESESETE